MKSASLNDSAKKGMLTRSMITSKGEVDDSAKKGKLTRNVTAGKVLDETDTA